MHSRPLLAAVPCIAALAAGCAGPRAPARPRQPDYWPTSGWRTASPESRGIDSAALAEALLHARASGSHVHSLLVVRGGYLVLEAYFHPYDGDAPHDVASVSKSVTSTLVGIAIDRGHLAGVDQRLTDVFASRPIAHRDERKDRVTIESLLTMTSGLDCRYEPAEATLREMRESPDWVQFMLDLPMAAEPETRFVY
ncbi:MAG: serine hydrolase [Planctomycetes bacterium]|nr:serine hydrolase [Planctomycetota bacterium]